MIDSAASPENLLGNDSDVERVYFGPFKSPEKKFLGGLAITQPVAPSPLRRSPRLSSPVPDRCGNYPDQDGEEHQLDDEDGNLSRSRSGTPDNDRWQQDEPSSLLAARITRAHDNPSPPPNAPVKDLDSGPSTPNEYLIHPIPFFIPDSPSPRSRGASPLSAQPAQPWPSPQNTSQHDLISFDSFSTSTDVTATRPIASTSFVPPVASNPSVDELLTSWSPSGSNAPLVHISPFASEAPGSNSKGKTRADNESTPESADEEAVVDALTFPDVNDVASAASPQPAAGDDTDAQQSVDEGPRTPLRRSTRPRRSGTPHAYLVPIPSSDEDESPVRAHLTPSGASMRRRKGKGKEREVSPARENVSDLRSGERGGVVDNSNDLFVSEADLEKKRRKERGERKLGTKNGAPRALLQRQLGSLSPDSVNLLTQLLPPSRPSPVRELEEPQQSAFSFSVSFPQAATSLSPATPVRPMSPVRSSPVRHATPGSPSKIQFQPGGLDDPNRTPARRIPVEQAVARGHISPQKGARLLSNHADVGMAVRTPVFHIPPSDTPARRINVVPPTADQGKWQGMRFGSPTRGISRERGGSVEARPPWPGATGGSTDLGVSVAKSCSSPPRSSSAPMRKGKLPFPLTSSGSDRPSSISEQNDKDSASVAEVLAHSPGKPPASSALGIIKVQRSNLKQTTSRIPRIGTKPYARPVPNPQLTSKSRNPLSLCGRSSQQGCLRRPR
ncbi:hypothetical protein B0H10DRAFT_853404 [Mycena sp. CBHHK59/15]|nr:hypothetical protein B0H10DRAFT_853404 [Mycena sp. CBHHK59/15]